MLKKLKITGAKQAMNDLKSLEAVSAGQADVQECSGYKERWKPDSAKHALKKEGLYESGCNMVLLDWQVLHSL